MRERERNRQGFKTLLAPCGSICSFSLFLNLPSSLQMFLSICVLFNFCCISFAWCHVTGSFFALTGDATSGTYQIVISHPDRNLWIVFQLSMEPFFLRLHFILISYFLSLCVSCPISRCSGFSLTYFFDRWRKHGNVHVNRWSPCLPALMLLGFDLVGLELTYMYLEPGLDTIQCDWTILIVR